MSGAPDLWRDVDPTLCPVCGRESCEDHLPSAARRVKLEALHAFDIIAESRPAEVVVGMAWAGCITTIISESGIGKTFLLLDLEAAVSNGLPWHGRDVTRGSVVHVTFERDALGTRLQVLRDVQRYRLDHFYVIRARDPISPRVTQQGEQPSAGETELIDALNRLNQKLADEERPPVVLVVFDTVRASLSGNEDSSEVVSAYLRAIARIGAEVPTAACILAHHSGWQDGEAKRKRERGSSAFRGNCDATFYIEGGEYDVERGEKPITLLTKKTRDAEPQPPLHLLLRRVELQGQVDKCGLTLTSCVVDLDRCPTAVREAAAKAARETHDADAAHKTDIRMLQFIARCPSRSGSQATIREALSTRKQDVSDSIRRLKEVGHVVDGGRGKPYAVTDEGRAWLAQQQ